MESAMEAVRSGEGINQAARLHGVPSIALKNRISGRVNHKTSCCPCKYQNVTGFAKTLCVLTRTEIHFCLL